MALEIRDKLEDYNTALMTQIKLHQVSGPRQHSINLLQDWLARKKGGNNFLSGVENTPWREEEQRDLVSFSNSTFDVLTSLVAEKVVPGLVACGLLTKNPMPGQEELGLREWSATSYHRASRAFVVIIATLMPSMATLVLYFVPSMIARILTAMLLSSVFSASMALSTKAKHAEIFSVTAAFAAVQVVFIGSTSLS